MKNRLPWNYKDETWHKYPFKQTVKDWRDIYFQKLTLIWGEVGYKILYEIYLPRGAIYTKLGLDTYGKVIIMELFFQI